MANILGINLNELRRADVAKKIEEFLGGANGHYLVTPNPEIILAAHRDEELFYILNHADLSLADGFGLKLAGWIMRQPVTRLTGADLTLELLDKAQAQKLKVAVLNWQDGLSKREEITAALRRRWPELDFLILDLDRVLFSREATSRKINVNGPFKEEGEEEGVGKEERKEVEEKKEKPESLLNREILNKINSFAPIILFCTFGFPYQEKVIYHNLAHWPTVRLALGIGGSFDFITGRAKRAPKLLRSVGLEWLYRLIRQPKRVRRIYNATFIFLKKILRARFINFFLYRPNVACLLYKKENGRAKILIVERENEPGHWQLPQGGLDDESVEEAGARELREETGAAQIATKGVFENLYRYKFNNYKFGSRKKNKNEKNKNKADNKNKEGNKNKENQKNKLDVFDYKKNKYDYKGQKQSLYIAEFLGDDRDLKVNFWDHAAWKWVEAERLPDEVHSIRRASAEIFLEKFRSLKL